MTQHATGNSLIWRFFFISISYFLHPLVRCVVFSLAEIGRYSHACLYVCMYILCFIVATLCYVACLYVGLCKHFLLNFVITCAVTSCVRVPLDTLGFTSFVLLHKHMYLDKYIDKTYIYKIY